MTAAGLRRAAAALLAALALAVGGARAARAASVDDLLRAYPDFLAGFDGANLLWRDGTRQPVGLLHRIAGGDDAADDVLEHASILDQLALPYPAGAPLLPPAADPGRARNAALFDKMYGDCRLGEVAPRLVPVVWLPETWGRAIRITSVNGVDRHLAAVSRELDALPAADKRFLYPLGGTYQCRSVAGTDQTSMHAWGAAIDIGTGASDYWRWHRTAGDPPPWRNRIPPEIVTIFERHGFIWGGRWSHYDTMHFEYRPELLGLRGE